MRRPWHVIYRIKKKVYRLVNGIMSRIPIAETILVLSVLIILLLLLRPFLVRVVRYILFS